jgi:predicted MFS family arabinose efflux permease
MTFPRREAQAVSLIGLAHFLSHVFTLALAPLMAVMTRDLNISYAELGIVVAVFALTTGVFQTPMGFLVERIGGRAVLIGGLVLNSVCFVWAGWFTTGLWDLLVVMALAGVGNAVFHPADYALLSSSVDKPRLGQAYSVHTLAGMVGLIVGPIMTVALEPSMGWRGAIAAVGLLGLATSAVLVVGAGMMSEGAEHKTKQRMSDSMRELLTSPAIVLFFLFYMCTSAANAGLTQFSIVAFQSMYGVEKAVAVTALTIYQIGSLALVLPGGVLADRTSRQDFYLALGFAITAAFVFLVGTGLLPFWFAVALLCLGGAIRGGLNSVRDVAVREIPTDIPVGTVFGFVSTGFLIGHALGSPLYGWLFDHFPPSYIFYVSALIHVIGIGIIAINPGARRSQAPAE